jgi:peptidoglycan glycosyltransferase
MRRVALVSMASIGVLAGWLTLQSVIAGSDYADDPRNARALPVPGETARGVITTADGVIVAEDTAEGRAYPLGGDYLHVVGYATVERSAGVESTRAIDLRPIDDGSLTAWLLGVFGASLEPPEVRLTVIDRLQQAATDGLVGKTGAVVALDPRTGAILAYASSPTMDPTDLIAGTVGVADFLERPESVDRAAFRLLPPGSIFKTLVSVAALEDGMTPDTEFEDLDEYLAPGAGLPIGNAGGGSCAGGGDITLRQALVVSCNTVFAPLAVEVGGEALVAIAERAGLNSVLPFELGAAISSIPDGTDLDADPAALAQTGIGERDVRVTPLQMAVIAGGIANGGRTMQPYVVDRVLTRDGSTLSATSPAELGRMFTGAVAADLVSMMIDVVAEGTGRAADLPDVTVAGKTGTAEGTDGNHAWFIAFAPAENPTIAIAVVVEDGGSGGAVAAPIAAEVLRAYFAIGG